MFQLDSYVLSGFACLMISYLFKYVWFMFSECKFMVANYGCYSLIWPLVGLRQGMTENRSGHLLWPDSVAFDNIRICQILVSQNYRIRILSRFML